MSIIFRAVVPCGELAAHEEVFAAESVGERWASQFCWWRRRHTRWKLAGASLPWFTYQLLQVVSSAFRLFVLKTQT